MAEAAHGAIQTGAFGNGTLTDVDVIKQAETHTAAVNGFDVFIDDGPYESVLRLIGRNGVEILVVFLVTLDHFLGFGLF